MYRAAWVQAVSALDYWVHREVYDRALAFTLNTEVTRPAGFLQLEIPMQLFEDIHHHSADLREKFKQYLKNEFARKTYQSPAGIAEGLRTVTDEPLWSTVAEKLTQAGQRMTAKDVKATLGAITNRRNKIVHEADFDPQGLGKREITSDDTDEAINRVRQIAEAISAALGPPPPDPISISDAPTDTPQEDDPQPAIGVARLELYREFWTRFDLIVKQRGWSRAAPPALNWWSLPSGIGDVTWSVSFAKFGCRSELYFGSTNAETNLARFRVLESRRDEIVEAFGDRLVFDELPGKKACRIETRLLGPTIDDRDEWTDVVRWMADTQQRLRSAIDRVGGIPTVVSWNT